MHIGTERGAGDYSSAKQHLNPKMPRCPSEGPSREEAPLDRFHTMYVGKRVSSYSSEVQITAAGPRSQFLETSHYVKNPPFDITLRMVPELDRFGTSFLSLLRQIPNLQHRPGPSSFNLAFIAICSFLQISTDYTVIFLCY